MDVGEFGCFVEGAGWRVNALMQSGWDRGRRVRGNLLYVVVEAEKVVVEYDGMEQGIADELIVRGVAEEYVVLAWLPHPVEEGSGDAIA